MTGQKGQMMEQRWAARLPMGLFTVNVETGEIKTIHRANDWLNHLLFSPTDPTLLMFCHEGPWHTDLVSPAAQRVVDPLQCHAGRKAALRGWRRSRPSGARA